MIPTLQSPENTCLWQTWPVKESQTRPASNGRFGSSRALTCGCHACLRVFHEARSTAYSCRVRGKGPGPDCVWCIKGTCAAQDAHEDPYTAADSISVPADSVCDHLCPIARPVPDASCCCGSDLVPRKCPNRFCEVPPPPLCCALTAFAGFSNGSQPLLCSTHGTWLADKPQLGRPSHWEFRTCGDESGQSSDKRPEMEEWGWGKVGIRRPGHTQVQTIVQTGLPQRCPQQSSGTLRLIHSTTPFPDPCCKDDVPPVALVKKKSAGLSPTARRALLRHAQATAVVILHVQSCRLVGFAVCAPQVRQFKAKSAIRAYLLLGSLAHLVVLPGLHTALDLSRGKCPNCLPADDGEAYCW